METKFCVTGEIEVVDMYCLPGTFKTLYYSLYSSQLINTDRKRCLHRVGSNWWEVLDEIRKMRSHRLHPPWKQGEDTANRQCGSYVVYHCQKIAGELLI